MLPNERYDKTSFHFFSPLATFYDRINTIYQFSKPFLDKTHVYFEEYGVLSNIFKLSSPLDSKQLQFKCNLKLFCITEVMPMYSIIYFHWIMFVAWFYR